MSGRRLADLLALAGATRAVIKRHAEIQLQAASRAAVTSSIRKTLNRDFRGYPIQPSPSPQSNSAASPSTKEEPLLEGKDQDVFYDRSESHSAPETSGPDELKIRQSEESFASYRQKEYNPTSASPSKSSRPINPIQDHHVRKMSTNRPIPSETAEDTSESSELRKNINEDVYYDTKATVTPNRVSEPDHIPRNAAEPPTLHDKLHNGINSEYYYDPQSDLETKSSKPKSVYPRNSPF